MAASRIRISRGRAANKTRRCGSVNSKRSSQAAMREAHTRIIFRAKISQKRNRRTMARLLSLIRRVAFFQPWVIADGKEEQLLGGRRLGFVVRSEEHTSE